MYKYHQIKRKLILTRYDCIEENIKAQVNGEIDFLICRKSGEQENKRVLSLYQHIVRNATVDPMQLMPIDIITRENYQFCKH